MTDCTCGEPTKHRATCPTDLARREREAAKVYELHERMERLATGQKRFHHEGHALGWFFAERERRSSARGLPLARLALSGGFGSSTTRDDNLGDAYASVLLAIKAAVEDAHPDGYSRHLARWLTDHHAKGRAYHWIVDETPGVSIDQMKRRMARAHRIIRDRLVSGGFIESTEAKR